MLEKILKKLKEAREKDSQVSDQTLDAQAKALVTIITTDELLTAFDAKATITSMEGNIRHIAKEAKETGIKEGAKAAKPAEAAPAGDDTKIPDDAPQYIKDILSQNKTLTEQNAALATKVDGVINSSTTQARLSKIKTAYAGMPQAAIDEAIADFGVMSFEDDAAFDTFVSRKTESNAATVADAKAKGLDFTVPAAAQVEKNAGGSPVLQSARDIINSAKEKAKKTE